MQADLNLHSVHIIFWFCHAVAYSQFSILQRYAGEKYHSSARHTLQKDPIPYNDEIAAMIGAKPSIWKHPDLAWRY